MTEERSKKEVTEYSEPELIRAAQQGSHDAYDRLVRNFQKQVYRWAYHLVRSHDLADEVAQEVFVRTYHALARIDPDRPLGAWLSRTTTNLALNLLRRIQYQTRRLEESRSSGNPSQISQNDPDEVLHNREILARVEKALATLPPHYRVTLILRVKEQMSYSEIAESLNISIGTVMSRLARARHRLRSILGDVLDDLFG